MILRHFYIKLAPHPKHIHPSEDDTKVYLTMKKQIISKTALLCSGILSLGATFDYLYIDADVSADSIINCLSGEVQKKGYTMELKGMQLPAVNSREFAVYDMSGFAGSFWIESAAEGRPVREAGITHATRQSSDDLHDALLLCSESLSGKTASIN